MHRCQARSEVCSHCSQALCQRCHLRRPGCWWTAAFQQCQHGGRQCSRHWCGLALLLLVPLASLAAAGLMVQADQGQPAQWLLLAPGALLAHPVPAAGPAAAPSPGRVAVPDGHPVLVAPGPAAASAAGQTRQMQLMHPQTRGLGTHGQETRSVTRATSHRSTPLRCRLAGRCPAAPMPPAAPACCAHLPPPQPPRPLPLSPAAGTMPLPPGGHPGLLAQQRQVRPPQPQAPPAAAAAGPPLVGPPPLGSRAWAGRSQSHRQRQGQLALVRPLGRAAAPAPGLAGPADGAAQVQGRWECLLQ